MGEVVTSSVYVSGADCVRSTVYGSDLSLLEAVVCTEVSTVCCAVGELTVHSAGWCGPYVSESVALFVASTLWLEIESSADSVSEWTLVDYVSLAADSGIGLGVTVSVTVVVWFCVWASVIDVSVVVSVAVCVNVEWSGSVNAVPVEGVRRVLSVGCCPDSASLNLFHTVVGDLYSDVGDSCPELCLVSVVGFDGSDDSCTTVVGVCVYS